MADQSAFPLIRTRYREAFGADLEPSFCRYRAIGAATPGAALGYTRAGHAPLFVEAYLDRPIEDLVADSLGRPVPRDAIVEIGNLASTSALSMIALWGATANDLADDCEIAVATLTAPLRHMFARIGIPITAIAMARAERLADCGAHWGRYYRFDPQVCIGNIADGQQVMADLVARRRRRSAA